MYSYIVFINSIAIIPKPPLKNPGSAPGMYVILLSSTVLIILSITFLDCVMPLLMVDWMMSENISKME